MKVKRDSNSLLAKRKRISCASVRYGSITLQQHQLCVVGDGDGIPTQAMEQFQFENPGVLRDGDLELVLIERLAGKASPWAVPVYMFEMCHWSTGGRIGRLSLRVSTMETIIRYAGQVGYSVEPAFRGHHFAERSCRLILPLAKRHGMSELWVTCSPDNTASRRTIERLGGIFVETLDVPADYPLPEGAIRKKSRFRLALI